MKRSPQLAISIVLWNDLQQVLLIKREQPPYQGKWTLPGGKVKWQETLLQACKRELWEETKLSANLKNLGLTIEIILENVHYVILPYLGTSPCGILTPNEEIIDAAFFQIEAIAQLETTPHLEEVIKSVLPNLQSHKPDLKN